MPKPKVNYTWNYFDDIGNCKVKCRICSIEFTKKTTNQENHLKRHHQIDRTNYESKDPSSCCSSSVSSSINTTDSSTNSSNSSLLLSSSVTSPLSLNSSSTAQSENLNNNNYLLKRKRIRTSKPSHIINTPNLTLNEPSNNQTMNFDLNSNILNTLASNSNNNSAMNSNLSLFYNLLFNLMQNSQIMRNNTTNNNLINQNSISNTSNNNLSNSNGTSQVGDDDDYHNNLIDDIDHFTTDGTDSSSKFNAYSDNVTNTSLEDDENENDFNKSPINSVSCLPNMNEIEVINVFFLFRRK
jgi:hypothetical protein